MEKHWCMRSKVNSPIPFGGALGYRLQIQLYGGAVWDYAKSTLIYSWICQLALYIIIMWSKFVRQHCLCMCVCVDKLIIKKLLTQRSESLMYMYVH